MPTKFEEYNEMMQAQDPELYVTKKQIEDLEKRGYGTAIVEYKVQSGSVISVKRSVELSNHANPATKKINLVYWLDWIKTKLTLQ